MNRIATASCIFLGLVMAVSLAACKRDEQTPVAPQAAVQTGAATTASYAAPESETILPERPTLRVTTFDGKPFDLASHRGNWVVVNFWATWCAPCLKEMPELSALDAMREHIKVVGLAYEDIEPTQMQAFLRAHPVVYPIVILDVYHPPKDFADPRGLPTTYLIAPDGRLAQHFLGPVTAKELEAAIVAKGGPDAAGPDAPGANQAGKDPGAVKQG